MARKVLNKPPSGLTPAIKSVATTKATRMTISSTNNQWYNSNGYSANISRQENDSRILVNAAGDILVAHPHTLLVWEFVLTGPNGSTDTQHGWGYFWEHNTADGNEGLFHCMKGLYNGHGLTNTTGNFEFRIGRTTANGNNSRPGHVWT